MAEDALHSAFASVLQGNKKIFEMGEIDLFKWCVISVKRKCFDLQRKESRYAGSSIDDFQDYLSSDSMPIDEHVARQDVYERLRENLKKLDSTSRHILEMKYVLNMSMKEIGNELGLTLDQVNSRIARARKKLRELMENEVVRHVR
jgi:RNA polymerase sigma-70 factor (ECF subfamily)